MKYIYYLWDFDGTLFDSYPHVLASMEKVLREEQIVCDSTELWRRLLVNFGEGRKYAGLSSETYKRFVDYQYLMDENEIEPKIVPFDGMRDLLADIVKHGGKNYLYTHTGPVAKDILKNLGIFDCFEFVLDASYHFPAKPAPDALLFLAEHCGLNPQECLMIGDRPIDALAGMNAGMLGFLWDEDNLYKDIKVDYHSKDITDVAKIVGI